MKKALDYLWGVFMEGIRPAKEKARIDRLSDQKEREERKKRIGWLSETGKPSYVFSEIGKVGNLIFDLLPEMICFIKADGTILFSNRAFQEYFGGHLNRKRCSRVLDCGCEGTELCPLIRAKTLKCGQSRQVIRNGEFFLEMVEPIENREVITYEFVLILVDFTLAKKAEEKLRENVEKYTSLFEHAKEGIFHLDETGMLIKANPSFKRMLGYHSFGELSEAANLYLRPEEREELFERIKKFGMIEGFETELRKKDGSRIPVRIDAHPVTDEKGKIIRIDGFVEDMTEKKKAELSVELIEERLRTSLGAIIRTLSSLLELRDPYTAGHQLRVSRLSRAIAKEMNLDIESVEWVRLAGAIHDVGKIAIPYEILNRPGKLLPAEMEIVKGHCEIGYRILKEAEMPEPVPEIVYEHHERLDGSGYPRGLKGNEILLEARIVAVADVVEAICSHRPYRPAFPIDHACNEIAEKRGILYDSDVVDACLKVLSGQDALP